MKIILLIIICCSCFVFSCNLFSSKRKLQDFIPGTYLTNWVGAYSETRDTLLIEPLLKEGSATYAITRRTFIHYTGAAVKKPPEYKIVHWTGSYNAGARTVVVENSGRVLSFDPDAQELIMGIVRYKKL